MCVCVRDCCCRAPMVRCFAATAPLPLRRYAIDAAVIMPRVMPLPLLHDMPHCCCCRCARHLPRHIITLIIRTAQNQMRGVKPPLLQFCRCSRYYAIITRAARARAAAIRGAFTLLFTLMPRACCAYCLSRHRYTCHILRHSAYSAIRAQPCRRRY